MVLQYIGIDQMETHIAIRIAKSRPDENHTISTLSRGIRVQRAAMMDFMTF